MAIETPIINILTYQLPYKLANQMYNEFQNRMKEATFLIDSYKTYSSLRENKKSVELFLSLSIFHKRLVTNLDGAVKFYGTVTKSEEADTISIGNYNLTLEEKNKILAVVLNYNNLLEKFSIPTRAMEYLETRDFLKNLIALKSIFEDGENQEGQNKRSRNQEDEDDIPF
jgi:hypothetical protein